MVERKAASSCCTARVSPHPHISEGVRVTYLDRETVWWSKALESREIDCWCCDGVPRIDFFFKQARRMYIDHVNILQTEYSSYVFLENRVGLGGADFFFFCHRARSGCRARHHPNSTYLPSIDAHTWVREIQGERDTGLTAPRDVCESMLV